MRCCRPAPTVRAPRSHRRFDRRTAPFADHRRQHCRLGRLDQWRAGADGDDRTTEGSTPVSSEQIDPGLKPYIDIAVADLAQRLSIDADRDQRGLGNAAAVVRIVAWDARNQVGNMPKSSPMAP